MKQLFLCDFDGTISTRDMGYVLLNRFSQGDWEAIDQEFSEGKIGSKEGYSRIAKIFKGKKQDILAFIRDHSDIDPAFSSFYRYCKESGIDIKIVSDGFDFYIETMLEIHRLSDIPYYANKCLFEEGDGKVFSFPYSNEECGLCGTCKNKILEDNRKEYDFIFFVGNGLSDRCAAGEADFVFAKGSLYPYCIDQDITCHSYRGFQDIMTDLKKRVRGVIFDLDGTLIDSYEAVYLGLKEAWEHFGKQMFPFDELKEYLKGDLEATFAPLLSPEEIPEAIAVMRKKYEEIYLEKTHLLDGAREVLETLHSRGIRLGLASNKLGRFSREVLAHLGLAGYFKSAIGAGDGMRNKPFPDMIEAVLREMNLSPSDAVFVGDTLTDIETGKQAGVDVYALPTGYHSRTELSKGRPKRILRNLRELLRAIEGPACASQTP